MENIYLFDWGDTLMVDFPDQTGKMRYWSKLEVAPHAEDTLRTLSLDSKIYVATNAQDSSEADIIAAFERAGLSQYIDGYFCKSNLGVSKNTPEFYEKIASALGAHPYTITMVGDSLQNDVLLPLRAGLKAIWLNNDSNESYSGKQIRGLNELCTQQNRLSSRSGKFRNEYLCDSR